MTNMNDITSDFACLKVSALGKASRISSKIDSITIGPNSESNNDKSTKLENIENEQNSCNVEISQKSGDDWNSNTSPHSNLKFSIKKIMFEEELQRREQVRKEIERKLQHMEENGSAIQKHMALFRSNMAQERERRSAQKFADILAEEEKIAEQEEIKRKHEQQLHAQRVHEQKERMKRDMEECRRKAKEKEDLMQKVVTLRNDFETKYNEIVMLLKDYNFVASNAVVLKQLYQRAEILDEKIKTGDLVPTDISIAETVVQWVDEIFYALKTELDRVADNLNTVPESNDTTQIQEQTENKKELPSEVSVEQQKVETETNKEEENELTTETSVTTSSKDEEDDLYIYVDKESLKIYIHSQEILESYAKKCREFLQSSNMKKFRFECQKAINIPVNAISAINEQHLIDKYEKLHNLLLGKSLLNIGQHWSQGVIYCKEILAKKIVSQGETLVSSKPKMAFAIAAIIVALWNDHPDFGELLLAHFHQTCPFIVPVFIPKREGQTNEEYYKLLGYKYAEDGSIEKQDKYLKRMSGLMRLYISITVTAQRKGVTKKHPHGLQHAWRWLAAVLNSESLSNTSDIRATLILDVLEVTGHTLWTAYPKQFPKLLRLLVNDYYSRMQISDGIGGGPLVRLEEFLKRTLTKGSIPPPDGYLPPNFW